MDKTVSITPDFERVKKWLEDLIDNPEARRRIMIRATLELKDRAAEEPAAGEWNSEPGTNRNGEWYYRRFGPRWRMEDGGVGGRNTSEDFQTSWRVEIAPKAFTADVFTPVSYAPKLLDPVRRASWAYGHGWLTVDEIAQGYSGRFLDIVEDELDKQIRKDI